MSRYYVENHTNSSPSGPKTANIALALQKTTKALESNTFCLEASNFLAFTKWRLFPEVLLSFLSFILQLWQHGLMGKGVVLTMTLIA